MKRLRIIGLALLALFALGVVVASTASAEEGFLPLNKKGLTVLGKTATLDTHEGGVPIVCKKVTGKGTFTNDSHGSGTLDFDECSALGFATNSLGDTSGLILASILFLVCLINSEKLVFGIFIETSPEVHLEVPFLGALIKVKGAVIAEVLTKKGKLFVIDLAGKEGLGNVAECKDEKGGVKKTNLMAQKDPEAAEEASENVEGGLMQFEEEVELMDK